MSTRYDDLTHGEQLLERIAKSVELLDDGGLATVIEDSASRVATAIHKLNAAVSEVAEQIRRLEVNQ